MRNFLSGREEFTARTLQERLHSVGSAFQLPDPFILVLLKIDRYKTIRDKYGDAIKLIKYAIMNICSEIAAASYRAEAVNLGEECMILLVNMDGTAEDDARLSGMLKRMQNSATIFMIEKV